jgi:hypothetical protein
LSLNTTPGWVSGAANTASQTATLDYLKPEAGTPFFVTLSGTLP